MKTIKLIDLLNKIANGEEVPKKVKFAGIIFGYDEDDQMYSNDEYKNICDYAFLNDEVEILEEEKKIPEKFKIHSLGDKDEYGNFVSSPFPTNEEFMDKINEIIDCLKSKGDE